MPVESLIKPSTYHDSVVLMNVGSAALSIEDVDKAAVVKERCERPGEVFLI